MTNEEVRDDLARLAGWRIFNMPSGPKLYLAPGKPDDADCQVDHPMPPTLDGANAAIPRGWRWQRWGPYYSARCVHPQAMIRMPVESRLVEVNDTGNPVHDLYALALACVRAGEAKG